MRRFPLEIVIVAFAAVMLYLGWRIYGFGELGRFAGVTRAQHAPSALYARLTIRYDRPPIYAEQYNMQDVEGVSTFSYRIRSYDGRQITVTQPPAQIYDVSFFFGKLDQDGVWQIVNKPPRPGAHAFYTVYVKQLADYKEGERTVTFTSPEYWATRKGNRFEIDLSKQSPNSLLYMRGVRLADPRYERIVQDFRSFGPPQFRHNVAAAYARLSRVK
jgi:hypothetical protein